MIPLLSKSHVQRFRLAVLGGFLVIVAGAFSLMVAAVDRQGVRAA